MNTSKDFTEGDIFLPLTRFSVPIFIALLLQFFYGAVDLYVVGQFSPVGDISGVAVGSQVTQTFTSFITGLSVGISVQVGQLMGQKKYSHLSKTIGAAICLFFIVAIILTLLLLLGAESIVRMIDTPIEAATQACSYIRICALGSIFIVAYNLLCSILRGAGNSNIPLISVATASVLNLFGDIFFVSSLKMGAAGAAYATVIAQAISVLFSLLVVRAKHFPFTVFLKDIRFDKVESVRILKLGFPVALQNGLLNISFLINRSFVNALGVYASSGVGISSKLSYIIMLIPEAYMQGLSSFTAQNIGANRVDRARRALLVSSVASFCVSALIFYPCFTHSTELVSIFVNDSQVSLAGGEYFRGAVIDCLFTSFSFCFIGYYNGCGMTKYVLLQGLIAAFAIRIPIAYYFSHLATPHLFLISLGSPIATVIQIILHLFALHYQIKREKFIYEK